MHIHSYWTVVGFAGQALFFGRFFVQWLASERRKTSVIPKAFWFLSLAGSAVLLAYAIHRRDQTAPHRLRLTARVGAQRVFGHDSDALQAERIVAPARFLQRRRDGLAVPCRRKVRPRR